MTDEQKERQDKVAAEQKAIATQTLATFLAVHKLKEFRNSEHNIRKALRLAGASLSQIAKIKRQTNTIGLAMISGPFDHGDIYGRDGAPLVFVGRPYQLHQDDLEYLGLLSEAGMSISIHGNSTYAWGSIQVEAWISLDAMRPGRPIVKRELTLVKP